MNTDTQIEISFHYYCVQFAANCRRRLYAICTLFRFCFRFADIPDKYFSASSVTFFPFFPSISTQLMHGWRTFFTFSPNFSSVQKFRNLSDFLPLCLRLLLIFLRKKNSEKKSEKGWKKSVEAEKFPRPISQKVGERRRNGGEIVPNWSSS